MRQRVLDEDRCTRAEDELAVRLRERDLARLGGEISADPAAARDLPIEVDERDEGDRRAGRERREARQSLERLGWRRFEQVRVAGWTARP